VMCCTRTGVTPGTNVGSVKGAMPGLVVIAIC
jgi:hypothetical protein